MRARCACTSGATKAPLEPITKTRSKAAVAFSWARWCSMLGIVALGGCTADRDIKPLGEIQQGLCASAPDNSCAIWAYDSGTDQWCTTGNAPAGSACTMDGTEELPGQCDSGGVCASAASWEHGSFRALEDGNPGGLSLAAFVTGLPHGTAFTPLDATRRDAFDAFVDGLMARADEALTDPYADWCQVIALADDAGYRVTRFFDPTTSRWLIYAHDDQGTGHAYFFVNPEPRRAVVLEAPHVGTPGSTFENETAREGVFLFQNLAARALVINGATRCVGATASPPTCGGTYSSDVCGPGTSGTNYHESDVAHSPTNAFHRFHARLDNNAQNRFVQLHGRGISGKHITAGDGRNADASGTDSMANDFRTELEALDAADSIDDFTTLSCQDGSATSYCGATNVQGRLTADGAPRASRPGCFFAGVDGTRFLHLEQGRDILRATWTAEANGWPDIASALRPITNCIEVTGCDDPLPAQESSIDSFALCM
jgi:hypothetical protein